MNKYTIIAIAGLVLFIVIVTILNKYIDKVKLKAYYQGLHDAGANINSFSFWMNGYPELNKCKYLLEYYAKWLIGNKSTPTDFMELRQKLLK